VAAQGELEVGDSHGPAAAALEAVDRGAGRLEAPVGCATSPAPVGMPWPTSPEMATIAASSSHPSASPWVSHTTARCRGRGRSRRSTRRRVAPAHPGAREHDAARGHPDEGFPGPGQLAEQADGSRGLERAHAFLDVAAGHEDDVGALEHVARAADIGLPSREADEVTSPAPAFFSSAAIMMKNARLSPLGAPT